MPTLTREALKSRMKTKYHEVFDDDRDGQADGTSVDLAIAHATSWMIAELNEKGFSVDQLERLCKDPIFIDAMAWKAADYGLSMKTEYVGDDGKTSYAGVLEAAKDLAFKVADQQLRAGSESAAGRPSTATARRLDPEPSFYVAPYPGRPRGAGGF